MVTNAAHRALPWLHHAQLARVSPQRPVHYSPSGASASPHHPVSTAAHDPVVATNSLADACNQAKEGQLYM